MSWKERALPLKDQSLPGWRSRAIPVNEQKGLVRRGSEAIIRSQALPIAGGIIGGIAGAPLLTVAGPLGPAATAGLGGAAGEAWRQNIARGLGMEAPKTATEAAKGIGISAATQAAGELGGRAIKPVAKVVGNLPFVKPILSGVKKTAGDVFQLATKIRPDDAGTLYRNPGSLLPGSMTRASENWRTAAKVSGLPVDDVDPRILEALEGDTKKIVFSNYRKLLSGEPLSASDAQISKQLIDMSLMPVAKTVRKNPIVSTYSKMRQAFMERISAESPKLAAANKEYAIASTGKRFRSLFPRNTTGDPAYFRSSILPAAGVLESFRDGDPGAAIKATAAQFAMSPLSIGSAIAGAGVARRLPIRRILAATAASQLAGKRNAGPLQPSNKTLNGQSGIPDNVKRNDGGNYSAKYQKNDGANSFDQSTPPKKLLRQKVDKVLTDTDAKNYLKKARGDRARARQLAVADGWTIPE